ncbi:MAG TPA: hypothetical protein PKE55_03095 [Kiritimatiellia bacterium]|nr:hypothetical protein [Kiritimatiellia bacterium]
MTTKAAYYNQVIILQSLSEGKTGRLLYDELNLLTIFTNGTVTAELVDVDDSTALFACINKITTDVYSGICKPLLHIETHGATDQSGLILSSNEFVSWSQLKEPLAALNDATQMNLIISISACYGAGLVDILHPTDRSPCWALVGPLHSMPAKELLRDYTSFFDELMHTQNGGKALQRLNRGNTGNDTLYYFTTAEMFFEEIWTDYIGDNCSDNSLNQRALEIIRLAKEAGSPVVPTIDEYKKRLWDLQPDIFRKQFEHFVFLDKHPQNRERFSMDYSRVKRNAQHAPP